MRAKINLIPRTEIDRVKPNVLLPITFIAGTDYYGAIRNTQEQLFGRKAAKKVEALDEEAKNPNLIVRL